MNDYPLTNDQIDRIIETERNKEHCGQIHPAFTIHNATTGRFIPKVEPTTELGKIKCFMTDCEHREGKYCTILHSSDAEDSWNDDDKKCGGYSSKKAKAEAARKARTFSNVTLSHEEIETLLALLSPSAGDTDEPNYELYISLFDRLTNPVANSMYFINHYSIDQQYGGPEEGGWWYHTHCCNWSLGFDCGIGWQSMQPVTDFNRIVDEFFAVLEEDEYPAQTKEEIIAFLKTNNHYQHFHADKYGEGWLLEITQSCAGAHDVKRQRYE